LNIHPTAEVQTPHIGTDTLIWQHVVILQGARIGAHCNINCHVFIENDVQIGNHVTIKSGVYLWDGIEIGDHAFIGPNATFTNVKYPRSKQYPDTFQPIRVQAYASIGAGAVILGGTTIGAFALVGAGAVVTQNVPSRALVVGNPARRIAWVNEDGSKMIQHADGTFVDNQNNVWLVHNHILIPA
jgi:UDP-2-acetamido-3-amino-2,3-dideoxy-glucuronate N-acetyltransferase